MLMPHMDAVEAAVYPTLERILNEREASAPMRLEHEEIRRSVERLGAIVGGPDPTFDRGSVLALRRVMLRPHVLLKTHLDEEELYLPILEDRLSPQGEAALGRALDHLAATPVPALSARHRPACRHRALGRPRHELGARSASSGPRSCSPATSRGGPRRFHSSCTASSRVATSTPRSRPLRSFVLAAAGVLVAVRALHWGRVPDLRSLG
jgi:hypothetical protein